MRTGMKAIIDEPNACSNNTKFLVMVKTAVTHTGNRMAIRQTWAKEKNIPVLFVVGRSPDSDVMVEVMSESQQFGDILMGDFTDSFWNLTLKTVFSFNWYLTRCSNPRLVYVDDDVIVNPENLIKFQAGAGLHCLLQHEDTPATDLYDRNYVPHDVYPHDYWPDYCIGTAIIMDKRTAEQLLAGALDNDIKPKIWIEDVFMYGIVRQRVGVTITDVPWIRIAGPVEETNDFAQVYDTMIIMCRVPWYRMNALWADKSYVEASFGEHIYLPGEWIQPMILFLVVAAFLLISSIAVYRFAGDHLSFPDRSEYDSLREVELEEPA
jgi:hypothetical protein